MLTEFRFSNYRSFRDEQQLSLVAHKADKSLPHNLLESSALPNHALVRSAVIYGANASGKSNALKALSFMEQMVRLSVQRPPLNSSGTLARTFRLDPDTINAPSEMQITFIQQGVRYEYGFVVGRRRFHGEWLIAYPEGRPQTWFKRELNTETNDYEWYFGSKLQGEKQRLKELTRPDVLFLSIGAQFNHQQLTPVYEWFAENLYVIDPTDTAHLQRHTAERVLEDSAFKERVAELLRLADLGISDFQIERKSGSNLNLSNEAPPPLQRWMAIMEEEGINIETVETSFFHKGKDGETVPIPFKDEDESLGTLRLFHLASTIIDALDHGHVLVIDEMDDSLHPLLIQAIVALFHDPQINQKGAQLIFNTHDTTLLNLDMLRRDQIWFVEKDREGASHLYALLEFNLRSDVAVNKHYLQGRYGAIPFVGGLAQELAAYAFSESA